MFWSSVFSFILWKFNSKYDSEYSYKKNTHSVLLCILSSGKELNSFLLFSFSCVCHWYLCYVPRLRPWSLTWMPRLRTCCRPAPRFSPKFTPTLWTLTCWRRNFIFRRGDDFLWEIVFILLTKEVRITMYQKNLQYWWMDNKWTGYCRKPVK